MISRISTKIMSVVMLLMIATLAVYTTDVAFWVDSHLIQAQSSDDNRETIHVAPYVYGETPPASLGAIEAPDDAYVHLKLRFRADSTEGYPNLFQTAPLNRGMRMEISGSTAAIVIPDLSVPGEIKGLTLTKTLKTGQWYSLEVEALNGSFVNATLDGHLVAEYVSDGLSMATSKLMVGAGFDESRTFRGDIENISITKGNVDYASLRTTVENRELLTVEPYIYGKTPPALLGAIKDPDNAYVHLKLRFRADSTEGYPNVFQTAPVNQGMRMEISGTTAAIVLPDKEVTGSGGLRGLTLTSELKTGQWYSLEVEALNGAFVKISLDGHLVKEYSGAGLSMDTSQFMVGGGFDASRDFKGEINNISLTKGNLNLPHLALRVVYGSLVALIGLFLFFLWKALGEYSVRQRLVCKLVVLAIPLLVILLYAEYRLSFLNTIYYTKRVALEEKIKDVEILVMGSSNTVYGVSPEAFSSNGFNLAFLGNGMFFDARLVDKYSEIMPNLRLVVLTVNYFTMGLDYSTFSQSWRQYFLRQNFNIPIKPTAWPLYDFKFWLHPRNFSRIALYGDRVKGFLSSGHSTPVDLITTPLGWYDSGDFSGDEQSSKLGVAAAEAHNATNDVENYDRNLGYWETLIPCLQQKEIATVIVMLPTDVSYYSNLDKAKIELMNQKLIEFAERHHIKYADYTGDARFSLNDFTGIMPDHMNATGAIKFSKILDDEVIRLF